MLRPTGHNNLEAIIIPSIYMRGGERTDAYILKIINSQNAVRFIHEHLSDFASAGKNNLNKK